MGVFDGLEDPLSEVSDALSDFGAQDEADSLDQATQIVQSAIAAAGGVPLVTTRFLIGTPDWTKAPVDSTDWQSVLQQSGYMVDNILQQTGATGPFGGPATGYGELGAALLNQGLKANVPGYADGHEQPGHVVLDLYVEEGLSKPWRAFVTLERPLQNPALMTPAGPGRDFGQELKDAFTSDSGGTDDGFSAAQDLINDPTAFAGQVMNMLANPQGQAQQYWDVQDPDLLDQTKLPIDHAAEGDRTVPADYLGQFARLCLARRLGVSHYTLNERWFSGVVTGFDDLGVAPGDPTRRRVRLTIRPRLYQLSYRKRFRMFKDLNAVQIAIQILKEHQIYPEDPGDRGYTALRLAPGGREAWGPIAVPDALPSAVDKIAGAVPFGLGESAGSEINSVLAQPVEDWRPKREYCVQYGETDLDFVERLLAEEGLTYFFENKERRETLVICEDPRLAGKKVLTAGRMPLLMRPGGGGTQLSEVMWTPAVARRPVPSGVTLRDRIHAHPYDSTDLKAGESLELLSPGGLSSLTSAGGLEQMANQVVGLATELVGTPGTEDYAGPEAQWFEWPARLPYPPDEEDPLGYEAYDGPPHAQLRLEGFRATGAIARCSSDCATLAPGANVRVLGEPFDVLHPPTAKPQRFLVTSVVHQTPRVQSGQPFGYSNTFEALNIGIPYRPAPPAARPRIEGVHTAVVVDTELVSDPADRTEVAVSEKQSAWRVRVRFPWERSADLEANGTKGGSPWLRFAAPFSGAGFGALLVPRLGMEVVVGYDEGDPDRPYVLGALYNAPHESPAGTRHASSFKPKDVASGRIDAQPRMNDSGFTTRAWPQGTLGEESRGSTLRLDDTQGNERIRFFAQRDLAEEVGEDHVTSVLGDQINTIGDDGSQSGRSQRELVHGDQTLLARYPSAGETDWGRDAQVEGDEEVKVGVPKKKKSSGEPGSEEQGSSDGSSGPKLMRDEVKKNDALEIGGARTLTVWGGETIEIAAEGAGADVPGRRLVITKSSTVEIDENDEYEVTGDRKVTAGEAYTLTASRIDITTAASPLEPGAEATGGLSIGEEGVALTSSGTATIETGSFTAQSGGDRVLVRAKTQIWIKDPESGNEILLDAASKTISIAAKDGTLLRVGTPEANVELQADAILLSAGASKWETTLMSDGTTTTLDGASATTLEGTDEIHVEAPSVELGQH